MRFLLVLFLVSIQALLPAGEKKGKLCVFIAGEASTPEMGQSVQADAEKIERTFQEIAKTLQMKSSVKIALGANFTSENFFAWARTIRKNRDYVVFYYSGAGKKDSHSKWPCIIMACDGEFGRLPGEKIFKGLMKNTFPKFGLVIFDCYGEGLNPGASVSTSHKNTKAPKFSKACLKNLFGKARGMIITSAGSDPKKCFYSSSAGSVGGVFTTNFLKGLVKKASSKKSDWVSVMDASQRLYKHEGKNHPLVEYRVAVLDLK